MSGIQATMVIVLASAASMGGAIEARGGEGDPGLRAQLERVSHKRILFGHQSVGMNVLDGIRKLAADAGVPLRITEVSNASAVPPGTLGHVFIRENGFPMKKLQSFEQAMGNQSTGLDVAMMKFCYLDIESNTDVTTLFARYLATTEKLQAENPGTIFVHVTLPLIAVQGGPKALVKRLLGRAPYGVLENLRREEYNTLLRRTYQGREPIFDLARLESTAPDGSSVTVEWRGHAIPAMTPAYTDDGGHLNALGKARAARELISVLASLPAPSTR